MSYCDKGDVFCGTSIFDIDDTVHVGYVDKYGDDVVELVVRAYENFEPEFSDASGLAADNTDDGDNNDDDEGAAVTLVPSLYAVSLLMMGAFHLVL